MDRKSLPPGYVETPGTQRRSRKSEVTSEQSQSDDDNVANGNGNGIKPANGALKSSKSKAKGQIVDGWLVGGDPRIDADPHFDFGGSLGVTAMMIGFPALMW